MQKYIHPVKYRGAVISPKAKLFNQGKKFAKKFQQQKKSFKSLQDKSVNRFWGNAARLEHRNVRNKNKGKKG